MEERRGISFDELYSLIHYNGEGVIVTPENMSQLYTLTKNLIDLFNLKIEK